MTRRGRVLWGSNNIYCVRLDDGAEVEARLKGKKLDVDAAVHNPLAPGDLVLVEQDGQISKRLERSNDLSRWNRKNSALQTIAANVDLVAIVASCGLPPFRPRFIDRALVLCTYTEIPCVLLVNKVDLGLADWEQERIDHYKHLGLDLRLISALDGRGCDDLPSLFAGKSVVFFGQSGAGKSTVLNRLVPGLAAKTGEVSQKFERGRHTTTLARAYAFGGPQVEGAATWPGGRGAGAGLIIDTPGIRELDISHIEPDQLKFCFPEFAKYQNLCRIPNCSHDHEPGCAVSEAFEDGRIHEDRFTSYLSLYYESSRAQKRNSETGKQK